MDSVILVKFSNKTIVDFCSICNSFTNCDVDVIDGSHVFDAKDYDSIVLLDFSKTYCVSINTKDVNDIYKFNDKLSKYKTQDIK